MTADGDRESCGHAWALHPGAIAPVTGCVQCVGEEDSNHRRDTDDDSRQT